MNAPETALVAVETLKAVEVFAPGGVAKLLDEVEAKVRQLNEAIDPTTEDGRAAAKSLAYKVVRSKTAVDEMGKEFVAEMKKATAGVDADRRTLRDRLDALRDEVRKPVDDWEAAEKEREDLLVKGIEALAALGMFDAGAEFDVEHIDKRLAAVEIARTRDWQEFSERAEQLLAKIPPLLAARREAAVKRAAEREELDRLRKAEADRLAQVEVERLAREQKERDEKVAADATAKAAQDAQDRIVAEQRRADAAEAARVEAELRAETQRKEAEAQALRDQEAAVERERKRVADAKAEEDRATAAREADRSHRAKINNAAVAGLMGAAALTEDQAKAVVKAIASGKISNVTISY